MLNGDVLPEFPQLLLYRPLDDSISKMSLPADYSWDFSGMRAAIINRWENVQIIVVLNCR